MASMTLRISEEKHNRLKALASARGVSINRLMDEAATVMLTEYDAEARFKTRAARGSSERGLALLDKALSSTG